MSETLSQSEGQELRGHYYLRLWPQISAFLLVVVELCWILPWFKMVTQITSTASLGITGLILGGIMLVAYAAGYLMEALRLIKNVQLAVTGALLVTSLLIAENLLLNAPIRSPASGLLRLDPGAVLVLFFVIWMWWRGLSLSRSDIRPFVAWRRFELGLLLFMGYIFIAARAGFFLPGFGVFILFLFSGLLSVVVARISYVGMVKGVRRNPFDLRWFASVSGILGAAVLLAVTVGGLLSGQYRLLLDFLSEAVRLLIAVTIFIIGIPGLLVSYIFFPWLRNILTLPQSTPVPENPTQNIFPVFPGQDQVVNLPLILQTLCFWGLVLVVVVALILRFRRALGFRHENKSAEPESLLKEGEARKLLRKSLQDAINALANRLRPAQHAIAAARVRRIYSQLLELCEELNQPRLPQQTPLEFLPEMGELFSKQIEDLHRITLAYNSIRYGEMPEKPDQLDEIENAWLNIQEEGRRLKRAGIRKLKTADIEEVERSGV